MMTTLRRRFSAAAVLAVKASRSAVCCLAIGCVLGAVVGCSPPQSGKSIMPDPDSVPPPSGGRTVADPSQLESVPIVVD
jgi:hypothetical protein